MKHLVGFTKNNIPVYVELIKSKAATHIARQPHLLTLTAEALQRITLKGSSNVNLEHDMERTIGYDYVVETNATSTVFYAQLVQDNMYTRFTKNSKPAPTTLLSMLISYDHEDKAFNVNDVWIGRLTPPWPGSAEETAESVPYWKEHALVFEKQPLQPRTITTQWPY